MKIDFDWAEVELKAKSAYKSESNQDALLRFLNELSIVYCEAAKQQESKGHTAIAKDYRKKSNMLFNICDTNGLYH